ncbi:MAG TPA: LysR family transcriptional regulator [Polyangia bacterium]|nr:LysR family transcriptional regulator [Polyangia bacterium]
MDLLEKMGTFVRVVEAGSFSSAAKQLRLSAAAVSRQIATLEEELQLSLLRRSTRHMAITPAGRLYYERCLRILREVDDAQALGRNAATDGFLRVNAPVTFGLARLVPHLHELLERHRGLRIDLRLEDRLIDLALEGMDVAIRVGGAPPESSDVVAQKLFAFRRILVASPRYLQRRGEPKTPEALAKHAALTHPFGNGRDSWLITNGAREVRVRLDIVVRSSALHAIRTLAVEGAGIALLPDWLVRDEVAARSLRKVLPAWHTEPVTVNALYRTAQRGSARVRALIDHLRTAYAEPKRQPASP